MKQLSIIYLIICSILVFGVILISISPGQAQEIGWAQGEVDTLGWPFRFNLPNPQPAGFPGGLPSRLILLGSNPSPGMIPLDIVFARIPDRSLFRMTTQSLYQVLSQAITTFLTLTSTLTST